ncbi:Modification methylase BspRI [Bremerella volcania]|uniref:Cytosine-specific methyltransferase n=1 Tax=Bremerella volcania TaxID=2527984 RepID=A0A518C3F7_9BACT|nr:DNA cytosine methyltransferase [Bremerella volcania]QDU73757.1 Modification methylase BspRI [Bremerella volcania]
MYRLNFPNTPLYHGDIANLTVEEALRLSGLAEGELDIFDGSPPCQGFSIAGKRQFHDARNQLFKEYVRLLRGLKPKAFIMENVAGMVKGKMKKIFAECLTELKASGYRVKAKLLDCSYFGVPQMRKRLIFIGIRRELGFEPSHPLPKGPVVSIMEAIDGADTSGVPELNDRYGLLYDQVPHGKSADYVIGTGYSSCVKPHPHKPSPTLPKTQTGRGFATIVHPYERRALSIGEAKRIGSFPDDFQLTGSYSEQWARIGNSVPPLFMRQIASHVANNLSQHVSERLAPN